MANRITGGITPWSTNFEAEIAAPFDARLTTPEYPQLADSSIPYPYPGMIVAVTNDEDRAGGGDAANNGIYLFTASASKSVADSQADWTQIGSSSVSITNVEIVAGNQVITLSDGTVYTTPIGRPVLNFVAGSGFYAVNDNGNYEGNSTANNNPLLHVQRGVTYIVKRTGAATSHPLYFSTTQLDQADALSAGILGGNWPLNDGEHITWKVPFDAPDEYYYFCEYHNSMQGVIKVEGAQGATGDKGATGGEGAKGEVGSKGDTGGEGAKGADGNPGSKGDTGGQGDKGADGNPGSKGDTGGKGDTGTKGEQGNSVTGAKGDTGTKGDTGGKGEQGNSVTGAKGATGGQGDKGEQGNSVTGAKGEQGASVTGAKGEQGASVTGAKGDQGEKGIDGDSVTGAKGDTGLKGATGDEGSKGEVGTKGDTGGEGAKGADGTKGDQGNSVTGAKGDTGSKGDTGDKGDTGAKGATGGEGSKGEVGSKGDTGGQGTKGDTGGQGDKGADGSKGDTGGEGAKGADGTKGDTGGEGAKGDTGLKGEQGNAVTGAKGDTGLKGEQGNSVTGAKGDTGLKGATGDEGGKGEVGSKGDTGGQGDKGDTGASVTGAKGTQGDKGQLGGVGPGITFLGSVPTSDDLPGSGNVGDAYISADDDHFWVWNGTIWVDGNSLQGQQGPKGNQGEKGVDGNSTNGSKGEKGEVGVSVTGDKGDTGLKGVPGLFQVDTTCTGSELTGQTDVYAFLDPTSGPYSIGQGDPNNRPSVYEALSQWHTAYTNDNPGYTGNLYISIPHGGSSKEQWLQHLVAITETNSGTRQAHIPNQNESGNIAGWVVTGSQTVGSNTYNYTTAGIPTDWGNINYVVPTRAFVINLTNESETAYHDSSSTSTLAGQPKAAWNSDRTNFVAAHTGMDYFGGILYPLAGNGNGSNISGPTAQMLLHGYAAITGQNPIVEADFQTALGVNFAGGNYTNFFSGAATNPYATANADISAYNYSGIFTKQSGGQTPSQGGTGLTLNFTAAEFAADINSILQGSDTTSQVNVVESYDPAGILSIRGFTSQTIDFNVNAEGCIEMEIDCVAVNDCLEIGTGEKGEPGIQGETGSCHTLNYTSGGTPSTGQFRMGNASPTTTAALNPSFRVLQTDPLGAQIALAQVGTIVTIEDFAGGGGTAAYTVSYLTAGSGFIDCNLTSFSGATFNFVDTVKYRICVSASPGAKGDQGDKGDTGASVTGPKGDTGASITGPKGDTGGQGDKGDTGASTTGDKGAKGSTGASVTGDKGDTGLKGATGDKGIQGASVTGDKGDTGGEGSKGEVGTKGDTGAKGDTGGEGSKGEVGTKGDTGGEGSKGEVGPKGDTGADVDYSTSFNGPHILGDDRNPSNPTLGSVTVDTGLSYQGGEYIIVAGDPSPGNFDIAQVTSYNSSTGEMMWNNVSQSTIFSNSQNWTINLTGIQGLKGEQGNSVTGAKGDTGEQGDKGATGASVTGPKGDQGDSVTGPKGDQGDSVTGPKGDQGDSVTGPKGDTGGQGDKGATGASVTGPKGDTGGQGDKGETGGQGDKGDTGASTTGDKGAKGGPGTKGSQGETGVGFEYEHIALNPIARDEAFSPEAVRKTFVKVPTTLDTSWYLWKIEASYGDASQTGATQFRLKKVNSSGTTNAVTGTAWTHASGTLMHTQTMSDDSINDLGGDYVYIDYISGAEDGTGYSVTLIWKKSIVE